MEVAAQGTGRSGCAASRSTGGYSVGRESFAPRGRKWGGIPAARSSRWPTCAEGEKRLLSAIKKPYAAILGTSALLRRSGSLTHSSGRYKRQAIGRLPVAVATDKLTAAWQFSFFPTRPPASCERPLPA